MSSELDRVTYEKCLLCHLFVEPEDDGYQHLHRGDEPDEQIDESHSAQPSGMKATLNVWKVYGPEAMRERFVLLDAGRKFYSPSSDIPDPDDIPVNLWRCQRCRTKYTGGESVADIAGCPEGGYCTPERTDA